MRNKKLNNSNSFLNGMFEHVLVSETTKKKKNSHYKQCTKQLFELGSIFPIIIQ